MVEKAGTWVMVVGFVISLGSLLAILITGRPFVKGLVIGRVVLLLGVVERLRQKGQRTPPTS